MMHMRAGFDHPHNAAAGLPGRADGAPGSGVGCSVRGQAGWPLIIAGRFQRDDGDEGGGMPIPQIVRQWNKAG
jgi:hypothetical protein